GQPSVRAASDGTCRRLPKVRAVRPSDNPGMPAANPGPRPFEGAQHQQLLRKFVRQSDRWRLLFGDLLAAKPLVQPAFDPAANGQDRESDDQCDDHHAPLSEAADNSDAGRQPGTGSAGESANPEMTPCVDNDACAEKADSGQDSLHHTAAGVGDDFG